MISFYKKFIVTIFLAFSWLFPQTVTFDTHIAVDHAHTFTIDEIRKNPYIPFTSMQTNPLNIGFSDAVYWLRLTIHNSSQTSENQYLVFENPIIETLDLFDGNTTAQYGLTHQDTKTHIYPTYKLALNANETRYIYLKVASHDTPINIKVRIYDETAFITKTSLYHFVMALFFGFLLALMIYNLSVYVSLRDKVYLSYVIYIFGVGLHHFYLKGFGQLYWTHEILRYIFNENGVLLVALMIFGMAQFTKHFLSIHPRSYWMLGYRVIQLLAMLVPLIMLYRPWYNFEWVLHWSMMSIVFMIVNAAVIVVVHKAKEARMYLIGWIPMLIMFVILGTQQTSGHTILETLPFFEEFAISFEAVVFSIALSLRLKAINNEKNRVAQELIAFKKEETLRLQAEVNTKTQEIQSQLKKSEVLLRELNHRVKNNMQIIISMLRMQADACDEKEKEIVRITQNRIRSMLFIHEMLYQYNDAFLTDSKYYIEQLIVKIRESYDEKQVRINTQITPLTIDIDRLVVLGFVLNELLTNALKHAKPIDILSISVRLEQEDDHYLLSVQDDGIAAIQNNKEQGLGMLFVHSMVTEYLYGTIEITTQQGYGVNIRFKAHISEES